MYWYNENYKRWKAVAAAAVTALLFSCGTNEKPAAKNRPFIDIPAFFKEEVKSLSARRPNVVKTVTKDTVSERKELQVENWANELSSFMTVDLNKPAYAGHLQKDSTANTVIIQSLDPAIDISRVEIQYGADGKPHEFLIKRTIKNSLYETRETLHYKKGASYSLEKHQSVLVLGDKYYRIEGIIE